MEGSNSSKRIEFIDALRGCTMILVVFAHVEMFGFFNFSYETFIGKLFQSFRMPLFFFISGYIAFNSSRIWNRDTCWQLIKKKMWIQVVPALFFGLIYTYGYLHSNLNLFLSDPSKAGYWFTFVLLEMFLIYYCINGVSHFISQKYELNEDKITTTSLISIALILYLLKLPFKIIPSLDIIGNYICLHYTFNYFGYFVLGVLLRRHLTIFEKLLSNSYFTAVVIFLFSLNFYSYYLLSSSLDLENVKLKVALTLIESIAGVLGIILVYSIFRKYSVQLGSRTKLGYILQYIGRRTLDIYLLHYFFLPHLSTFGEFLINSKNIVIELIVGFSLSLVIVFLCICVSNILRLSPFLGKYLFGARG